MNSNLAMLIIVTMFVIGLTNIIYLFGLILTAGILALAVDDMNELADMKSAIEVMDSRRLLNTYGQ